MSQMDSWVKVLCILLTVKGDPCTCRSHYVAAVYEHLPETALNQTELARNRKEALEVLQSNLNVLEQQVKIASSKHADIFVFPEYGLTGALTTRATTSHFVETIPDAAMTKFYPCNGTRVTGQETLHRLSCIASNYSIYLTVNMGDRQPCLKEMDLECPLDGAYQYNTDVVFDKSGCLVSRYHKKHLFQAEKLRWDEPNVADISYFDTDFGRFGLMICFDAVYADPGVELVTIYNVTDILFSTAWMNVYPHYVSVAYHSGWARTMTVNYLSSNIHYPAGRLVGSGIYSPNGIISYTFNQSTENGHLVIADVPINNGISSLENGKYPEFKSETILENYREPFEQSYRNADNPEFEGEIFGDEYRFKKLIGLQGLMQICEKEICCYLEFSRSEETEMYALGVFNGMHFLQGEYYLEVCMLVVCPENTTTMCGSKPLATVNTIFSYFNLTGSMQTPYAFPQVVTADFTFPSDWKLRNNDRVKSVIGGNDRYSPISIVLMGRNFKKDPKILHNRNCASIKYDKLLLIGALLVLLAFNNMFCHV